MTYGDTPVFILTDGVDEAEFVQLLKENDYKLGHNAEDAEYTIVEGDE